MKLRQRLASLLRVLGLNKLARRVWPQDGGPRPKPPPQ